MCSSRCTLALAFVLSSLLACQDKANQSLPDGGHGDAGSTSDAGPLDGGVCHTAGCDCSIQPCADGFTCGADHKCAEAPTCSALYVDCEFVDCCQPADPLMGAWCNEEGKCTPCGKQGHTCTTDYDCCPMYPSDSIMCTSKHTCEPICNKDTDCANGEICLSTGECVPVACSGDGDCAGKQCCAGECKDDCGYGAPVACFITTRSDVVSKVRTVRLHAVATNAAGDLVPKQTFTWTSSDESKIKVDADGVAVGQDAPGAATITARLGLLDCGTVTLRNLPVLADGKVRVVVLDKSTGEPISGAQVIIGSSVAATTDADGIATSDSTPADIHVFHADYSYVSMLGAAMSDYLIYLTPVEMKAGGFKSQFDYALFHHQLYLGLAGCSIVDAFDLGPRAVFGETLLTHLKMETAKGDITDFDDWMALSTGLQMGQRNTDNSQRGYIDSRVKCTGGYRSAWGIGTSYTPMILIEIIGPVYPTSGSNAVDFLSTILDGRHAVQPFFKVEPIPLIPTPTTDTVDKEPISPSSFIPDYSSFPEINMKLELEFRSRTLVTMPLQPKIKGAFIGDVLAIEGVVVPDMGLVPLSLAADADASDPKDGVIDAVLTIDKGTVAGQLIFQGAPPHHGLEGLKFQSIFMATDLDGHNQLSPFIFNSPAPVSAILVTSDRIDPQIDLTGKPFMPFAEGASFSRATREIGTAVVDGADFDRYQIGVEEGRNWSVYVEPVVNVPFTLPTVPAGMADVGADSNLVIHAVKLKDGRTLGDIVSMPTAVRPDDLMSVIDQFSSLPCLKRYLPSDKQYNEECLTKYPDPACDPACELK